MRKPKIRELAEAVRALVRGPITTRFPFEPHDPPEGFRGKPQFDPDTCIGCKACVEVCPAHAIDVADDLSCQPPMRRLDLHYDRCIFCGHCELNCTTTTGIHLTKEYDLACFDRTGCVESVENELVVCEVCGAIVGTRKHLLHVAGRLGAKRFASPTLFLLVDAQFGCVESDGCDEEGHLRHEDALRVLCPRCRRTLVLQELWGDE